MKDAKELTIDEAIALIRPRDSVATGLATGQAVGKVAHGGENDHGLPRRVEKALFLSLAPIWRSIVNRLQHSCCSAHRLSHAIHA